MSGDNLPGGPERAELAAQARAVLEGHAQPQGYCVPNRAAYPHQWLWDSCFHAVVWAQLGEGERAVAELRAAVAHQAPDGFVPHVTYWDDPELDAEFWGRPMTSCLTQPPMLGHALAVLDRTGVDVPDDLLDAAARSLAFLAEHRARGLAGGVVVVHPWETGCDDSPRWDAWAPSPWTFAAWKQVKGELVGEVVLDRDTRSPVGSHRFEVESAGFNALVAFNAAELASLGVDAYPFASDGFVELLRRRWDPARRTFHDHVRTGPHTTDRVRTLDALLPVLVLDADDDAAVLDEVFAEVRDPSGFGGPFGPAATHRAEPSFDPGGYWRGATWPQLTYLLWVAATRLGRSDDASWLAGRLVEGAQRSGMAEYWHPDTGAGRGAAPQSWTALATVVAPSP